MGIEIIPHILTSVGQVIIHFASLMYPVSLQLLTYICSSQQVLWECTFSKHFQVYLSFFMPITFLTLTAFSDTNGFLFIWVLGGLVDTFTWSLQLDHSFSNILWSILLVSGIKALSITKKGSLSGFNVIHPHFFTVADIPVLWFI